MYEADTHTFKQNMHSAEMSLLTVSVSKKNYHTTRILIYGYEI